MTRSTQARPEKQRDQGDQQQNACNRDMSHNTKKEVQHELILVTIILEPWQQLLNTN